MVRPYSLAVSDRYAVLRFQCPASSHPPTRNSTKAENLSQNMCNVTPETVCDGPPIAVTRSAVKPAAEKILLKNRNVAGFVTRRVIAFLLLD